MNIKYNIDSNIFLLSNGQQSVPVNNCGVVGNKLIGLQAVGIRRLVNWFSPRPLD